MSNTLEDARAAAAAANQVVADLENPENEVSVGEPSAQEFQSSCIVNADGSVIITLTPIAPASVSESEDNSSNELSASEEPEVGQSPTGQVSEVESGPQPTS